MQQRHNNSKLGTEPMEYPLRCGWSAVQIDESAVPSIKEGVVSAADYIADSRTTAVTAAAIAYSRSVGFWRTCGSKSRENGAACAGLIDEVLKLRCCKGRDETTR